MEAAVRSQGVRRAERGCAAQRAHSLARQAPQSGAVRRVGRRAADKRWPAGERRAKAEAIRHGPTACWPASNC